MSEPASSRRRSTRGWGTVATPVLQFLLAGAVALVLVALALSVASRRIGEREAIVDARSETLMKAQGAVEPALTDALIEGDPKAIADLDEVVRGRVLSPSLARVKVWKADGTIIYSDEPRLIGKRYHLGDDEQEALREGLIQAEVSDLSKPENRYEKPERKLLEVYLPVTLPSGERVLFETYYVYDKVNSSGDRIWRSFAPISIGALIALELILLPLAWSLARRLRTRQLEREDLLERAIGASEHERRRIAQDLHDGVVQDLAGVSFSLAAIGRQDDATHRAEIDAAAETVRSSIGALRTLLVELYPPNLEEEGLGPALDDLLERARAVGLEATVDTTGLAADLPMGVARLIYRTVQEALRNVIAHAGATHVHVTAASEGAMAWAEVVDDGAGFDVEAARARAGEGHVGLLGVSDLAADSGGELRVTSAPGRGTTVRIEVPVP
ncbi:MAG: sensor histidine kinase [Acidimicrobiales bacterium]